MLHFIGLGMSNVTRTHSHRKTVRSCSLHETRENQLMLWFGKEGRDTHRFINSNISSVWMHLLVLCPYNWETVLSIWFRGQRPSLKIEHPKIGIACSISYYMYECASLMIIECVRTSDMRVEHTVHSIEWFYILRECIVCGMSNMLLFVYYCKKKCAFQMVRRLIGGGTYTLTTLMII